MSFAFSGLYGLCSNICGASASLGYLQQKCYEHKWASPVALLRPKERGKEWRARHRLPIFFISPKQARAITWKSPVRSVARMFVLQSTQPVPLPPPRASCIFYQSPRFPTAPKHHSIAAHRLRSRSISLLRSAVRALLAPPGGRSRLAICELRSIVSKPPSTVAGPTWRETTS